MNKYLVLLCFTFLFSNSFCVDCTEDNIWTYDGIEDEEKDYYVCIEENGSCALKLKCIYPVKTEND